MHIPPLATSIIGSHSIPVWLITATEAIARGEYGPKDAREMFDDAVDLALREQEEAGIDIISDGEMRRMGFFTAGFYHHMTGLRAEPAQRKLGPAGHDQREKYHADEAIQAPNGLGLVDEFEYARSRTTKPLKVPCAGPFTLAGRILPGPIYADRLEAAFGLAEVINAELKALVQAGATFIQLDEPSYAVHSNKHDTQTFIDLFNRTIDGVDARIGLHLCFGNFVGRPVAHRTYAPLFPHVLDLNIDEFAMEFANRELAELELTAQIAEAGKTVAAGLVDVKNYFIETPEIVADRIARALDYVPAEQLVVTPDCGFSETARWATNAKMKAMVDGTQLAKQRAGVA
ncbi:MAG: methionine synthase [Rhodothermales bacterium]